MSSIFLTSYWNVKALLHEKVKIFGVISHLASVSFRYKFNMCTGELDKISLRKERVLYEYRQSDSLEMGILGTRNNL